MLVVGNDDELALESMSTLSLGRRFISGGLGGEVVAGSSVLLWRQVTNKQWRKATKIAPDMTPRIPIKRGESPMEIW